MEVNLDRDLSGKVVLITGGAQRLGAVTAKFLHAAGANLVIHYRYANEAAQKLQNLLME